MNDTADPSSRRYRFNPRVLFSCAIFILSFSLIPAYVGTVGVAAIGETEAPAHVETTEAVAARKGEHRRRRHTVTRRMRWQRRLLATSRDEAQRSWRGHQGGRLPLNPCHALVPTRAPPTSS